MPNLTGLTTRSIDVMKFTKDAVPNQLSDAEMSDVVNRIVTEAKPTHIAMSMPFDSDAEFRAYGTIPSPRTAEAHYQKWCDVIHGANNTKAIHRGVWCAAEYDDQANTGKAIWNFPLAKEGTPYFLPQGTPAGVLGSTVTDNFTRASVGASYTEVVPWSIVGNVLKSPAPNAWKNLVLTTATYSDFDVTARLKKPTAGSTNTQLAFRTGINEGYGLQIRDNNIVRLERWGLVNLKQVTKTLVNGNWYKARVRCIGSRIQCKVWDDGGTEPSAWDIDITDTAHTSGKIGFSSEVAGAEFDDLVISAPTSTYNSTWLGKCYAQILLNPTYFADGDIYAPFPEPTGRVFNGQSFLGYTSPGIQANFANFFNDLITVANAAFSAIGKTVTTGHTANNYSEIRSGWIPSSVFTSANIIAVDYYGNWNNEGYLASTYQTHFEAIYNTIAKPIFWQELGDINTFGQSEAARVTYLNAILDMVQTLNAAGKMTGLNFWGGWENTQNTGIMYKDGNGKWQFDARGKALAAAFNPVPIVTPPAPTPAPITPGGYKKRSKAKVGNYTRRGRPRLTNLYPRGGALSALEFGDAIPGVLNQDYYTFTNADWAYMAKKGFHNMRLPVKWERLQPEPFGALDVTHVALINAQIALAKANGMKVIPDIHNYGRRRMYANGGFLDDFDQRVAPH